MFASNSSSRLLRPRRAARHQSVALAAACVLALAGAPGHAAQTSGRPGSAPFGSADWAQNNPQLEQFMKLSPDVRHDCIVGGFGMMGLPAVYSKAVTPDVLAKEADSLIHASTLMHLPRLRADYQAMAARVRLHGGEALSKDPAMNAAAADLDAWQRATCPRSPSHDRHPTSAPQQG